jgi:hypothetical protein
VNIAGARDAFGAQAHRLVATVRSIPPRPKT